MDQANLRPQPGPPQIVRHATAHGKWSMHYNAVARPMLPRSPQPNADSPLCRLRTSLARDERRSESRSPLTTLVGAESSDQFDDGEPHQGLSKQLRTDCISPTAYALGVHHVPDQDRPANQSYQEAERARRGQSDDVQEERR